MNHIYQLLLVLLVGLLNVHNTTAQYDAHNDCFCRQAGADSCGIPVEKFAIYYWRDGIEIDEEYLDNRVQTDHIKDYLARSPRIDSLTIYAYASPEGVYEHNVWLSRKRAEAARRYILDHLPADRPLDDARIRIRPMEENWTGLREEIEANYHRADRDRVMAILDAPVGNDTKKWRLQQLDNGYTYKYIIRHHMPRLRVATWICVWEHPVEMVRPIAPRELKFDNRIMNSDLTLDRSSVDVPDAILPKSYDKRTILALKTNMLYDAATWLNFAVEVPIARRFSILYEHHCPWWVTADNKLCLEFLSFGGEFRWWFSPPRYRSATKNRFRRDVLAGHFMGVYGMGGKFDLQARRTGCYQGEFFSVGLTYGYSMPICKHLNLEFSISAGYARIPYRHYIPTDDWQILIRDRNKAGTWNYIGPTKIEIALVCPIMVRYAKRGGSR